MLFAVILQILCMVNAYGFIGHRLSAALTWDLLSDQAKDRLGFKCDQGTAFIRLACRPDRIKHRRGMEWAQSLHFLNTQDYPPYYCQGKEGLQGIAEASPDNLLQAARNYTNKLADLLGAKGKLSRRDQLQVLSFAVHFVSDLHQPLHVCSREKGGNRRRVRFLGKKRSLHSLWDTHLLKHIMDTYSVKGVYIALRSRTRRIREHHANLDIEDWAAHTNSFNCRYVWRHLSDGDLSTGYLRSVKYAVLELIALSALRTSRLLEGICA